MTDPEEPLELGEPDKIILLGGIRQGGKIAQTINEAYERGRADALKELASGRTLWTTSCNLKAIESGGDCEINVWTFKPDITDLVPVKLVKMEVASED